MGVGKTTLIRVLLEQLTPDQHAVSIIDPLLSPGQFMRALVKSLGNEPPKHMRADLVEQAQNLLLSFYRQGRYPVVIIDEAQLCSKALLDEIRLITNFQLNHLNLLSLVLVGQTELRVRLKKPAYAPLRQRIGIHYHLQPLSPEDTMAYVNHRLRRAGVRPTTVFSADALQAMHHLSGGIPRVINVLCTNAMITAFSRKEKPVSLDILEEAAEQVV